MNVKAIRVSGAVLITGLLTTWGVIVFSPDSGSARLLVEAETIPAARPQSGLQDAAIVYEYVTEGGISRFSVIYTSPPKGRVGPIRSARLVTISLAKIYGAALVYSGGSTYIQSQIQSARIPHADENSANADLFRDSKRTPPHNLYSDRSHLSDLAGHINASPASWSLWNRAASASVTAGKQASTATVPESA